MADQQILTIEILPIFVFKKLPRLISESTQNTANLDLKLGSRLIVNPSYNRGNTVGDLVYGKLLVANKDMEPELVCIDSAGRSAGMGVIGRDGGFLHTCSLNLIRKMLSPDCPLLKQLGRSMKYEITVGVNGRIWVQARSVIQTITVINAIDAAEFMSNEQIISMCKKLGEVFVEKE